MPYIFPKTKGRSLTLSLRSVSFGIWSKHERLSTIIMTLQQGMCYKAGMSSLTRTSTTLSLPGLRRSPNDMSTWNIQTSHWSQLIHLHLLHDGLDMSASNQTIMVSSVVQVNRRSRSQNLLLMLLRAKSGLVQCEER